MDKSILISNIILSMRKFQEKNCIEKQCITNTQYLYDCIKQIGFNNVKAKAVYVFSNDVETSTAIFVAGHLIVVLDDETMIDPSYDIFCLKDKSYFDNIKDLIDIFDDKNKLKTNIDIKKLIGEHITFMKVAEQINNNECIITDKKIYNDQADYIEKLYSKKIVPKKENGR